MDDQNRRRWEVKDTILSDWRELLGEFTAQEIWEMRRKGDFWVALPVREGHELIEGPNGRGGRP
jgi:hypothetical protein